MVKPLKIAGICGIILIILLFISIFLLTSVIFSQFNSLNPDFKESANQQNNAMLDAATILLLISYLVSIGFLSGFVSLGRRYNNKALSATGWIFIFLAIIGFIFTLSLYLSGSLYPETQLTKTGLSFKEMLREKASQIPAFEALLNLLGESGFWPLIILFVGTGLILKIIFGISLYQLKKNDMPLAGWAGSFEIGSIILNLLGIVAIILETIMFFKESSKLEKV